MNKRMSVYVRFVKDTFSQNVHAKPRIVSTLLTVRFVKVFASKRLACDIFFTILLEHIKEFNLWYIF